MSDEPIYDPTVDQAVRLTLAIISPATTPEMVVGTLRAMYDGLRGLGVPEVPEVPEGPVVEKATPKQIRDSITPEGLRSFEDGKVYKSLKRHLSKHGLTPQDYRAKWGLPTDYAMVSAEYSERRSALAKAAGLGRK